MSKTNVINNLIMGYILLREYLRITRGNIFKTMCVLCLYFVKTPDFQLVFDP